MSSNVELLARADALRRSAQLREAELLYREILAADPANATAHHQFGLLLFDEGRLDEAVDALQQAWSLNPASPEIQADLRRAVAAQGNHLGNELVAQGKFAEAAVCYRRAVQARPDYALAHNNLAVALKELGQLDEAAGCCRRAIELKPDCAEAYYNLATVAVDQRQSGAAEAALRRAIEFKPDFPEAHSNLALVLKEQGRLAEAEAAFRHVLALAPAHAEVHNNLGSVLLKQGKLSEAEARCRQALELAPQFAEAHNNLGAVLKEQRRLDEAAVAFRKALELNPNYAEAHNNLGVVLRDQNRLDVSAASFRRAVELKPEYAEAHYNLACTLLVMGRLGEGWSEYEWRWKCRGVEEQVLSRPRWTGGPLAGRTILLRSEQGFGDILQFVRYGELVKRQGATVLVECPVAVKSLLARCPWVDGVVAAGERLPDFDFHLPLLSLPAIFRTSLADIPATIPYLSADAQTFRRWKNELEGDRGFKIGIAWQGDPQNPRDTFRSFPLDLFEPIARIGRVHLYSLQMGAGREQLTEMAGRWPITDLGDRLGDFGNTAGIVQNLDLVITCCSAPAHVAGALGVPVWVPLTFAPDWRWMLDREDSPWYPSMRLFRQSRMGDWPGVFHRMREVLAEKLQ